MLDVVESLEHYPCYSVHALLGEPEKNFAALAVFIEKREVQSTNRNFHHFQTSVVVKFHTKLRVVTNMLLNKERLVLWHRTSRFAGVQRACFELFTTGAFCWE